MSQTGTNGFALKRPSGTQYQIQKMNDTHMAIIRLMLSGVKDCDIAQMLGITEAMVQYTKKSPIVQQKLNVMRNILDMEALDTSRMIQDLQPVAIMKLAELLTKAGTDDKLLASVAQDLLDRGGHLPPKQAEVHLHASVSDIEEIKAMAKARGRENGSIVVEDAKIIDTE